MKNIFAVFIFFIAAASFINWPSRTPAQNEPGAQQIINKSLQSFYYQGPDMKAKVHMVLTDRNGKERSRSLMMLRINLPENGDQKYFIYFFEPGDVRGMTFMVWKYNTKDDDRWLFIPAVDLIRRIASDDKRSSFVGSDFTYEDISGRNPSSENHKLAGSESLDGKDCYVIKSIPKEIIDYTKRISWIDKNSFIPLKEEYYDRQNELSRIFTAERIEDIKSVSGAAVYPTVMTRTMSNIRTGHKTVVTFEHISYGQNLKEKDFSERFLRKPPRQWIR